MRAFVAAAVAAMLLAMPSPVEAQGKDLPFAAFFGQYSGGGVAESSEAGTRGSSTMRDSIVEIRPAGAGFSVAWSTTSRGSASGQPKVKTTEVTFNPTPKANVFEAAKQGNPVAGADFIWARISRQTLTVYALTTAADGRYELQKWDRTLQGTGMAMTYTRISDGEQTRIVRARLVKDKK